MISSRRQHLIHFCRWLRTTCAKWYHRRRRHTTTITFSSMALPTQLKHVFTLIDSNGDGKISPPELQHLLLRLGYDKSTAEKEALGMIAVVDLDGDGLIDFDEFIQVVVSGDEGDDHEVVVEAFRAFDRDGDGVISARELRKVMAELMGDGWCSKRECCDMIRRVDRNGDGVVDLEEFRLMMMNGRR